MVNDRLFSFFSPLSFCIYFIQTYRNKDRKVAIRGWGADSSEIEHISMFEALGSISSTKTKELDVGVYAFIPSTKQVDAEGSLHAQFCTRAAK